MVPAEYKTLGTMVSTGHRAPLNHSNPFHALMIPFRSIILNRVLTLSTMNGHHCKIVENIRLVDNPQISVVAQIYMLQRAREHRFFYSSPSTPSRGAE